MKMPIPFLFFCALALAVRAQDTPTPPAPQPNQAPQTLPVPQAPSPAPSQPAVAPAVPQPLKPENAAFRARYGLPPAAVAPAPPTTSFSERLRNIISGVDRSANAGPLVVRSSAMDLKEQGNLEQDLTIMAHILDKASEENPGPATPVRAMGINVFGNAAASAPGTVYLEGYGALFTLTVGFPLVPPSASEQPEKQQSAASSTWEEARQELYGGGPAVLDPTTGLPVAASPAYSEERVNHLQQAILEALKNASNIRGLKPDDSVTVCVLGGRTGAGTYAAANRRPPPRIDPTTGLPDSSAGSRPSTMTIRVKKTDVDAFAKGKVSLDEFRKRARIETYAASAPAEANPLFGAAAVGGGL